MVAEIKRKLCEKIFCETKLSALRRAAIEQGLAGLRKELENIVADIKDQYSCFQINDPYLEVKVRNLHAFQVSLLNRVIDSFRKAVIVDIGDSSGAHLQYIKALHGKDKDINFLSLNIDPQAVARIRDKGFGALQAKAEDVDQHNIQADIFLCFETLEHLTDPARFLYKISSNTKAHFLIVTVPYLRTSRVGFHHIRNNGSEKACAENTHIFELSPEDWKLLMRHSGWSAFFEQVYLQYPTKGVLRLTKNLWKRFDFEGFYGVILTRDNRWSAQYSDW